MNYGNSSKVLAAEDTVHSWQIRTRVSCEALLSLVEDLWDKQVRTWTWFLLSFCRLLGTEIR